MRKAAVPVLALTIAVVIVAALLSWAFAPDPKPAPQAATQGAPASQGPEDATLPTLVGQTAPVAVTTLTGLGFRVAGFTDASGKGRQWDDSASANPPWVVCFQSPAPGTRNVNKVVTMSVVPRTETCPARDKGWPYAGGTGLQEDFAGQTVQHATDIAAANATVVVTDARSGAKLAKPEGTWLVCAGVTKPEPIPTPLANEVDLQAVPAGVDCPGG